MTVPNIIRTARRQWIVLVAGLLVGVVGALAVIIATPDRYESSVSVYLTAASAEGDVGLDSQSATLAQQRTASYSQFLTSLRLAGEVSQRLRLDMSPDELADEITVSTTPDSAVLRATVSDTSPQRAKAIADGVGAVFVELVARFEQPRDPLRPPTVSAQILDGALLPSRPVSPVVGLDLGLGVLLGLVLGVVVALVREAADPRVRDTDDLAEVYGGPVLAATPVGGMTPEDAAFDSSRRSPVAEAFRRLRTHLVLAGADDVKVLAVVSAGAREGRTTTAIHLALALHEDGRRVCVVEADLREAAVAGEVGVSPSNGLGDVLQGRLGLDAATQAFGSGVDVIVAGRPVPNPAELLGGPAMTTLLAALRKRYDVVVFDTPASTSVADALVVASRADACLLVVRLGVSIADEVRTTVTDFEASGVRLAGAVVVGGAPATTRESARGGSDRARAAAPSFRPGVFASLSSRLSLPNLPRGTASTVEVSTEKTGE